MRERIGWLAAATAVACLAGGAPAVAGVVKASIGVGATVVASCRIAPGQRQQCARTAAQASTIVAEQPVVTFSRDPRTGVVTQTIEF